MSVPECDLDPGEMPFMGRTHMPAPVLDLDDALTMARPPADRDDPNPPPDVSGSSDPTPERAGARIREGSQTEIRNTANDIQRYIESSYDDPVSARPIGSDAFDHQSHLRLRQRAMRRLSVKHLKRLLLMVSFIVFTLSLLRVSTPEFLDLFNADIDPALIMATAGIAVFLFVSLSHMLAATFLSNELSLRDIAGEVAQDRGYLPIWEVEALAEEPLSAKDVMWTFATKMLLASFLFSLMSLVVEKTLILELAPPTIPAVSTPSPSDPLQDQGMKTIPAAQEVDTLPPASRQTAGVLNDPPATEKPAPQPVQETAEIAPVTAAMMPGAVPDMVPLAAPAAEQSDQSLGNALTRIFPVLDCPLLTSEAKNNPDADKRGKFAMTAAMLHCR